MIFNLVSYLLLLSIPVVPAAPTQGKISLPIEVAGADGTSATAHVSIPATQVAQVRSLQLKIHGLAYADMVSVRVNGCAWISLNNETVSVSEPGRSYGGIGGGFATLDVTLPLPPLAVTDQRNTVEFRFNRTDGLVSGFRVLAFNFLDADGRPILTSGAFVQEDPDTWTAPLSGQDQIAAGQIAWNRASLIQNDLPNAKPIRAHCADCHAHDGADLKYFNFSNTSIVARSRFHGLSELEGKQIASYIRSLTVPNPGRPWNPPFQPGPGLDRQPVGSWAAGAGLTSVLGQDTDTLPYLFGNKGPTAAAFNPDGNLNTREIPIAMQLPDWNHWLPRIHPMDAWGEHFDNSKFAAAYSETPRDDAELNAFFANWLRARDKFLKPLTPAPAKWTPELGNAFYSTQLWQLAKSWEIMQKFSYASSGSSRTWPNIIPAATAPADVHIPDGKSGMGGSALTNEYYSNAWYELQLVVNNGGHHHHDRSPIDWIYVIGRFLDLQQQSHQPEPGRLLVAIIKALQSTDPKLGPTNLAEGWRPDQNVDPRILISGRWASEFKPLPSNLRRALTESLLSAWLDKTLQYPAVSYFQRGLAGSFYRLPPEFLDISGGKVWLAAPKFREAGVSEPTERRLEEWGKTSTSMAQLFHY